MLKTIKKLLLQVMDDIDTGNSNISKEDEERIIKFLKDITDKSEKLSKYQACKYLNISRATFDNLIRDGKIPKGRKQQGFKELFWIKKDLDKVEYGNKHKDS